MYNDKIKNKITGICISANRWRKKIYDAINKKLREKGERKIKFEKTELKLVLYFSKSKIKFVDVDNRLKDVMDALQARWGGKISKNNSIPLIKNDNTIYKVTVEKRISPWQSKGLGHLIIQRMK